MQNTSLYQRARPNCEVPECAIPDAEKPHTLDTCSVAINSHNVTMHHGLRACHCLPLHLWTSLHVLGSLLSVLEIEDKCTLGSCGYCTCKVCEHERSIHISANVSRKTTHRTSRTASAVSGAVMSRSCCFFVFACKVPNAPHSMLQHVARIINHYSLYYLSFTTMQPRLFLAVVHDGAGIVFIITEHYVTALGIFGFLCLCCSLQLCNPWVLTSATYIALCSCRTSKLMSWVLSLDPPASVMVYALVLTPTIKFAAPSLQLFWDSLPPRQLRQQMPRQTPQHCKGIEICPKSRVVNAKLLRSLPHISTIFHIAIGSIIFWRAATAQCGCDELWDAAYDVFKPCGTSRYKSYIGHAETALHLWHQFHEPGSK